MSKLSAEAYAIVEGRHSDPFRYLGMHTEGGKTVVRAFLPEASNVEAIGHLATPKAPAHLQGSDAPCQVRLADSPDGSANPPVRLYDTSGPGS